MDLAEETLCSGIGNVEIGNSRDTSTTNPTLDAY